MYTEKATGHWMGGNYIRDYLDISKSQAPMNIRGDLWRDMDGGDFNTKDVDQNIELGVITLKRISQAIEGPTIAKVGTLWNSTAKDKVSDFGARVEHNYQNRWWETPKTPNIMSNKQ